MKTHPPEHRAVAPKGPDFKAMLDTVDANIWEADPATLQRSYVSRYAEVLLGYPRDEWTKPGFWQGIVHPEDRERVVEEVSRRAERDEEFEEVYRVVTADRRVLWVRDLVHVARDASGAKRLRGVMIDETRLHEATAALRASEQRLRAIFESARDFAIFTLDLEGKIVDWNPGAANMFGCPRRWSAKRGP
jgi:PAS domain S-box-containing protein